MNWVASRALGRTHRSCTAPVSEPGLPFCFERVPLGFAEQVASRRRSRTRRPVGGDFHDTPATPPLPGRRPLSVRDLRPAPATPRAEPVRISAPPAGQPTRARYSPLVSPNLVRFAEPAALVVKHTPAPIFGGPRRNWRLRAFPAFAQGTSAHAPSVIGFETSRVRVPPRRTNNLMWVSRTFASAAVKNHES